VASAGRHPPLWVRERDRRRSGKAAGGLRKGARATDSGASNFLRPVALGGHGERRLDGGAAEGRNPHLKPGEARRFSGGGGGGIPAR